jgi:hypothetical protein
MTSEPILWSRLDSRQRLPTRNYRCFFGAVAGLTGTAGAFDDAEPVPDAGDFDAFNESGLTGTGGGDGAFGALAGVPMDGALGTFAGESDDVAGLAGDAGVFEEEEVEIGLACEPDVGTLAFLNASGLGGTAGGAFDD